METNAVLVQSRVAQEFEIQIWREPSAPDDEDGNLLLHATLIVLSDSYG